MDCDKNIDYHSIRNMMVRWGRFVPSEALKHFNNETFSARTYNRRLTMLQSFFRWMVKSNMVAINPLEDVVPKKIKKTEKPSRKPFTEDEIKRVLDAFKNDTHCPKSSGYKHSSYYPFVYFIFKTGARNAEVIGLRAKHVNLQPNVIEIKEVLARTLKGTNASARIRKETKNGKERNIPLTEDLKEVLPPLIEHKQPDDLVFTSYAGNAIDDKMFQRRIFSKVLKGLNIEHRVLYACRHTFNSRCIQSVINPVTTAFLMGNNPETALRNYTHLLELPGIYPTFLNAKQLIQDKFCFSCYLVALLYILNRESCFR